MKHYHSSKKLHVTKEVACSTRLRLRVPITAAQRVATPPADCQHGLAVQPSRTASWPNDRWSSRSSSICLRLESANPARRRSGIRYRGCASSPHATFCRRCCARRLARCAWLAPAACSESPRPLSRMGFGLSAASIMLFTELRRGILESAAI
jgi:hypothetical protein